MRRPFILFIFCFAVYSAAGQKTDRKLQKKIEALEKDFHGDLGIYVKDLRTGKTVSLNADTIFPTASIVKVPILVGMMDKINRGELSYHQNIQYRDSLKYSAFDVLAAYRDSQTIELGRAMMLMLTLSDNTASLWLQSLAGGGARINELLDSMGLRHTRVNSRTPGREAIRNIYGWGQTTPREIATLFESIYNGAVISKAASDKMLRLLNRNFFDIAAVSQVPPYATVFTKYGALNENRNEVLLVVHGKTRYVFSIFSKNNKDQSWKNSNEAWTLTRKLSALLWKYYNPKDKWVPAVDAEKFD
jgi:beta-lactamase class A